MGDGDIGFGAAAMGERRKMAAQVIKQSINHAIKQSGDRKLQKERQRAMEFVRNNDGAHMH